MGYTSETSTDEAGEKLGTAHYSYDTSNRLIERTGTFVDFTRKYELGDDGRILKETALDDHGELLAVTENTYDVKGLLLQSVTDSHIVGYTTTNRYMYILFK